MINDLKDFEKFLKICRKQGITEASFQGTSVKFGDLPNKNAGDDSDEIQTPDELSPEEMMFYAVGRENPA